MRKLPRKPQDSRPTRDRACIARRPANFRYSDSRSSELELRLFQRHEKFANSRCTMSCVLRCIAFASTLIATKSVPSRELALILFQRHEESTNDCVASTLVATKSVPSSELVLILFQRHEKKVRRPANAHNCRARACVARRPANLSYAFILLQRHEKSANRALHNALRCVAFASMFVATQRDARVDSHSIFAFLRLAPRIR